MYPSSCPSRLARMVAIHRIPLVAQPYWVHALPHQIGIRDSRRTVCLMPGVPRITSGLQRLLLRRIYGGLEKPAQPRENKHAPVSNQRLGIETPDERPASACTSTSSQSIPSFWIRSQLNLRCSLMHVTQNSGEKHLASAHQAAHPLSSRLLPSFYLPPS